MQVKRFSEAKTYEAPNHRDFTGLRLFGAEAGDGAIRPIASITKVAFLCAASAPSPITNRSFRKRRF